ncbi:MAG: DUF58 domain-containing protein [Acidimicrobiales bacterium]
MAPGRHDEREAWGRPALTGRAPLLVAGAALLLLVWPLGAGLGAAVLSGAVVAALATDLLLAPRPARVGVARSLPAVVGLGSRASLTWTVHNPCPRPLVVRIADELAPSLGASARRARVRLPPRRSVALTVVLAPTRRGRFTPSELVVRAEGPLGLMARQARRRLPGELRVYPSFGSRRQADLRIERARILEVGLRSARARGGGTEFEQLREYGVDDDSRRIDWAATARSDRPIVRTYRAERNQRVVCLVDNGRTMAGQVEGVARVEHAIDAVLMLTSVAARMGDMPGLVAFDYAVRAVVPPRSGPGQLAAVTEALYDLAPQLSQSDYRGAFAEVLARFQRRAMLCLVTELDEALVDTLLPSLPLIARTHLLVVAAVRDPAVVRWATEAPADIESAYRAAAAVSALARRRELGTLLQARGAVVVDDVPGRLGPALTDAYLRVKAEGRL